MKTGKGRVGMHRLQEFVRLSREGFAVQKVAKLLGMSPNTERVYRRGLMAAGLLAGTGALPELDTLKAAVTAHIHFRESPHHVSSVESHRAAIESHWKRGLGARAIYEHLRIGDESFGGSYAAVKRMVRHQDAAKPVTPEDVVLRVETGPAEVAQVDYGEIGNVIHPETKKLCRAWIFVMVLAYSREVYSEIVLDQKMETWWMCHVHAFEFFGGVPKRIVPDNLKTAVTKAAFSSSDVADLSHSYRELARGYGFIVDPTPAYSPEKKGKVESWIKYAKHSFFKGREGEALESLRAQYTIWLRGVASERLHGGTGMKPRELLDEEKTHLRPLPPERPEVVLWKWAKVHRDCHIQVERHQYSVPWKLLGKKVLVKLTPKMVDIQFEDTRVALHERGSTTGRFVRCTNETHLPEGRRDFRQQSEPYWLERAEAVGPETLQYCKAIFDSDAELSLLRVVQSVVSHLESFPKIRAEGASKRAHHFRNFRYAGIRKILKEGLDQKPLTESFPSDWDHRTPVYSRLAEFSSPAAKKAVPHETH